MKLEYECQIKNGQPVFIEPIKLPENAKFTITIINVSVPTKTKAQRQNEALKKLASNLAEIDDEPFDDEFDKIMQGRFNIGRKLDI